MSSAWLASILFVPGQLLWEHLLSQDCWLCQSDNHNGLLFYHFLPQFNYCLRNLLLAILTLYFLVTFVTVHLFVFTTLPTLNTAVWCPMYYKAHTKASGQACTGLSATVISTRGSHNQLLGQERWPQPRSSPSVGCKQKLNFPNTSVLGWNWSWTETFALQGIPAVWTRMTFCLLEKYVLTSRIFITKHRTYKAFKTHRIIVFG